MIQDVNSAFSPDHSLLSFRSTATRWSQCRSLLLHCSTRPSSSSIRVVLLDIEWDTWNVRLTYGRVAQNEQWQSFYETEVVWIGSPAKACLYSCERMYCNDGSTLVIFAPVRQLLMPKMICANSDEKVPTTWLLCGYFTISSSSNMWQLRRFVQPLCNKEDQCR